MTSGKVSRLQDPEAWESEANLILICAERLLEGRLTLVLGAGASAGFGLPSWTTLVDRLLAALNTARPAGASDAAAAEIAWAKCGSDDIAFAKLVRTELYRGYSFDLSAMQAQNLLAAVGALAMASSRGRVAHIVTLNFDVVLETYLGAFGLVTEPVGQAPSWNSRADVRVLHPHGVLPPEGEIRAGIVFTQGDFDRIVGDAKNAWHARLLDIFSAHTCLFIGLSGDDQNLTSLLGATKEAHPGLKEGEAYWGIEVTRRPTKNPHIWSNRKVRSLELGSFDDIPLFLLRICQEASRIARGSSGVSS
jgi:hypothetical protein